MAAAYELGEDTCRNIRAIEIRPEAANRMTWTLRLSKAPLPNYVHVLPNIRRVCIKDKRFPLGSFVGDHDSVIRAVRLHFGQKDLKVDFA
jgi:hypothetical protein